jgi:hypothetical protein
MANPERRTVNGAGSNSERTPTLLFQCCAICREVLQLCRPAVIGWLDVLLDSSVCGLFKWRQFEPQVILLAIGWYLRFSLSYRDVEELLAEGGLSVDHVTVWRWVQRYAPKLERRLRRHLKPTNDSWRVDETYVRVKGKWVRITGRSSVGSTRASISARSGVRGAPLPVTKRFI